MEQGNCIILRMKLCVYVQGTADKSSLFMYKAGSASIVVLFSPVCESSPWVQYYSLGFGQFAVCI